MWHSAKLLQLQKSRKKALVGTNQDHQDFWCLLAGKDIFGLGTEAIDAPSRHTLVIADGDGEAAVISTRDFDDFAGIEAFQMQTCPLAGESRFFPWVFIWVSICKDRVIESFAWCASAPFFSINVCVCKRKIAVFWAGIPPLKLMLSLSCWHSKTQKSFDI